MKVLKEGIWNVLWSGTYICPTCKAELLVEEADLKPQANACVTYCTCALCGHSIVIPEKDLPLRVTEALGKKRKWRSSSSWD